MGKRGDGRCVCHGCHSNLEKEQRWELEGKKVVKEEERLIYIVPFM
jgi:hypothetical protein